MNARVHRKVVRDREFPEKMMVDQELGLEIVEVLEGAPPSLTGWWTRTRTGKVRQ